MIVARSYPLIPHPASRDWKRKRVAIGSDLTVGRLHWSATVPFPLQILGLIGFATGMALTTWAMLVNRFFSSAVRLQPERGQHVVTSGPYRTRTPPRLLGRAAVAAEHRLGAWLLDCHRPDAAHRTIHGQTHLDRGAHARQRAPRLRGLYAAGPVADRSGRMVKRHELPRNWSRPLIRHPGCESILS